MMAPLPAHRGPNEWLIGTAITRPFVFRDEAGDLIGLDVDLATEIAARLGRSVRWVEMPFATLIPTLADGQVDLVLAGLCVPDVHAAAGAVAAADRTGGSAR